MKRTVFGFAVLLAALYGPSAASAQVDLPDRPNGYVLDEADAISAATESELNAALGDYDRRTTNQVVVLLVRTTGDAGIENFVIDTANKWGVGQEGRDNGVILAIATEDRRGRIEVGRGLEGDLTDLESSRILSDHVFPRLSAGQPDQAVLAGQQAIRAALGDPNAAAPTPVAPVQESPEGDSNASWIVPLIVIGALALGRMFGGGRRGRRGGFGGGGPFIFYGGGGGGGWGGGGGGGFGGFGGGGFGGGGASGSW